MTNTYQDALRFALPVLALAQAFGGQFHQFTGLGVSIPERSANAETAAIPATYAFAIWGLIFLWSLAFAIYQSLPGQRDNAVLERLRGPAAAAFLLNTVWEVNAQLNGIEWVSFALIVALLAASLASVARLAGDGGPMIARDRWLAAAPLHVLAGWISVATFAHLSSTLAATGDLGLGLSGTVRDTVLVLGAAAVGSVVAARARREVHLPYALTVVWGLTGVLAANIARVPNATVAGAALVGIAIVLGAVALAPRTQARSSGQRQPA